MRHLKKGAAILAVAAVALTSLACAEDEPDPVSPPQPEVFSATLTAAAERPDTVTSPATGTASLNFTGTGAITYSVQVSGLLSVPVAAHIHGPAGVEGTADVIVGLTPISSVTTGALASGTITATTAPTISMDSLKVLLRNGNAYINVHTTDHAGGEIRGQIIKQP